jgi:putative redox protein
MPTEAHVHAVHEGGMRISAGDGTYSIAMDYPMPGADAEPVGITPLKTLLASLAGCSGNALAVLLAKMHQPVDGIEVDVRAVRRDEHPTVYTEIALEFLVRGNGVDPAAVERAVGLADEQICPVWAMLKPGTSISASWRVEA